MAWEQEISQKLQIAQSIAVRYDVEQALAEEQKSTAKNNVGVTVSVERKTGADYKITFNY